MKISLQWLKEFVEIDISPQELAHRLTHAGLEVESIQSVGQISDLVTVVQIEKIEKHPQADRLSLCDVNLGNEKRTIVCGAKNMKVGDKVPLAPPGCVLPDGKKIEKSKIRGIESQGMLCSEVELGLFEESSGLMILATHLEIGKPLASQMDLQDVIFEINVTPNRADCLSIYGVAREVAALLGKELKTLSASLPLGKFSLEDKIKLEVKSPSLCPRYTARMIQNVKVGPSSFETRLRLHRLGFRSINNVVDATNYVMLELGQPLHAFDFSEIKGGKIIIRSAQEKEKTKTLDGLERNLDSSDLLITDESQILAIAGVMGCSSSAVSEKTNTLLLESAYFKAQNVRKTSRKLALQTESSYRFERGVDPNGIRLASDRLAALILQWAGGELSQEVLDTAEKPFEILKVNLRLSRIRQVLGVDWREDEIEKILSSLGLQVQKTNSDIWNCSVPSYRQDLSREIDLLEEVARMMGYDKISPTLPKGSFRVAKDYQESSLEKFLKNFFSREGFLESIHYSFGSKKEFRHCDIAEAQWLELANPLSEELSWMRPSLVPSLLLCLQRNIARQSEDLKFFELRNVYQKTTSDKITENKSLVFAMSGKKNAPSWNLSKEEVDFYDLKGIIEKIWEIYKLPSFQLKLSSSSYFHPGMSASLWVGDKKLGDFGQLHPQISEDFDLRVPVLLAELDVDSMLSVGREEVHFQEMSKFPWIDRDLTLVTSESLASEEVMDSIFSLKIPWLQKIKCVDVYRGDPIEKGKKALTYSLIYLAPEKTLTDVEVNEAHQRVMDHLKKVLPIQWR